MTKSDWCCRCLGAGMLIVSMSGCMMPIPPYSVDEVVVARRDRVGHWLLRFEPGTATRRDLVLALGAPDAVSIDESKLVYWSPKDVASWLVYIPLGMSNTHTDWDVDYFVAEFDDRGLLVDFREQDNLPELIPALQDYAGQRVLFQHEAMMFKVHQWWPDDYMMAGTLILTEVELVFLSKKLIANAPADFRLAYSSMADEEIKAFIDEALWVHCDSGAVYKFMIDNPYGNSDLLNEAHGIIQLRRSH